MLHWPYRVLTPNFGHPQFKPKLDQSACSARTCKQIQRIKNGSRRRPIANVSPFQTVTWETGYDIQPQVTQPEQLSLSDMFHSLNMD